MKKPVTISIVGKQNINENTDRIEFFTQGHLYKRKDCLYLSYFETDEEDISNLTTVKIDGEQSLIITKGGRYKSQLVLEKGKRHYCPYGTEFGEFMMGVNTRDISSSLTESGGEIKADYELEINHSLASRNSMKIIVKDISGKKSIYEKASFPLN